MYVIKYTSDWTTWVPLPKTPSKSQPLDDSRSYFKPSFVEAKPMLISTLKTKHFFEENEGPEKIPKFNLLNCFSKIKAFMADYNARHEVDLRTARRTYQNWINYGFTWERKKRLEELIFTWAIRRYMDCSGDPFLICWESTSQSPTTFLVNTSMNQWRNKPVVSLVQCFFVIVAQSEDRLQGKWRLTWKIFSI